MAMRLEPGAVLALGEDALRCDHGAERAGVTVRDPLPALGRGVAPEGVEGRLAPPARHELDGRARELHESIVVGLLNGGAARAGVADARHPGTDQRAGDDDVGRGWGR